jgi:hypothetical protein
VDDQSPPEENSEKPDAGLPPPDVAKPDDPPTASPATAEQLTEVEEQMSGFEKSTLRWAKTAVIMSGLAAIFVCAQWWEMHKGGIDTKNLATAAGTQAAAASGFAKSASEIDTKIGLVEWDFSRMARNSEEAIRATQESMRLDQRAWLGFGDAKFTISATDMSAGFTARNVGKTPATKVITNVAWTGKIAGTPLTTKDIVYPQKNLESGTIFPSQIFEVSNSLPKPVPAYQSRFVEELRGESRFLYVFGKIEYLDVFGLPHWTHYCVVVSQDLKGNRPCDIYNDSDSDHQKQSPNPN